MSSETNINSDPIKAHREVKIEWNRDYQYYRILDLWLSAVVIVSSAIVAAKASLNLPDMFTSILALITVIAAAWVGKTKPAESADRTRMAWALLGNAIDRFDQKEPGADTDSVRRACELGEAIIRRTTPLAIATVDQMLNKVTS